MTWDEERRRKQQQLTVRRAKRILARLNAPPTDAEAARSELMRRASHYAIDNRHATAKQTAERLEVLIAQDALLRSAVDKLQVDLLRMELGRIAREAVKKAPTIRRLSNQMQEHVRRRARPL
jgi:hypothetical protein